MAYQALYRKWRPLIFDDVIGQRHVTETIKNEVKNDNVGHAFLFCGSRGTGKTTTARIFSRAINCENPRGGNPCNKCPTCRGILDGSIMDITEIDAASNSGVDNIRSLREEAGYTAAVTKYKVYIIDEVHALSAGAFNALLKLLEEPPEHVKFVLATTEAHKVMDTISSRCQRFDFKRITAEDIYDRLEYICRAEGIDAEERALRMIASAADGSMRDALSCLDPCVAAGKVVDTDFVADFLGRAQGDSVLSLCRAIAGENSAGAVEAIDTVTARGRALAPFIETVIKALRDMLVLRATGKMNSDFSPEEQNELRGIATAVSPEKLLYSIRTLSDALASAKKTSVPAVIFQSTAIKLCIPHNDGSYDALLARVGELERKLAEGTVTAASAKAAPVPAQPPEEPAEELPLEPEKEIYAPQSEFIEKIRDKWPEIMNDVCNDFKIQLFTYLQSCSLREHRGKLAVTLSDEAFPIYRDEVKANLDYIKKLVKKHCGLDCGVTVKADSDFGKNELMRESDPMEELIDLPITEVE